MAQPRPSHRPSFSPMENARPKGVLTYGMDWVIKAHGVGVEEGIPCGIGPLDDPFLSPVYGPMIDPTSRLLTPNSSGDEQLSDSGGDRDAVVSVSSSFYPGAHATSHDVIFRTNDHVLFYLHTSTLRRVSANAFEAFLSPIASSQDDIIDIPEVSAVFNVIAHALYDTSCAAQAPSVDTIEQAIDRMPFYGISPSVHITSSSQLYALLLTHSPLVPLRVYTLAAKHGLHDLAVQSSSHSLSVPLSAVTDDLASRMGAVYLKNLMCLHMRRQENLKSILLHPPELHPPTKTCTFQGQKRLSRAWALAASYLAWDAKLDIPLTELHQTFTSLEDGLDCEQCKSMLRVRTKQVLVQWAAAKRTI